MTLLNAIAENRLLSGWGSLLERHPTQRNDIHCSDAELLPLSPNITLAIAIDSVVEEIATGLYDAETAGWVAVAAALSDLAAVGAAPAGLTTSVTLPADSVAQVQCDVGRGMSGACAAAGTWVLGGDTNIGRDLTITVNATGIVADRKFVTRIGSRPGDTLFATGLMGAGALAAAALIPEMSNIRCAPFRPLPRLAEGRLIAQLATACMDTSDGFISTLDQLARLNGVGFDVHTEPAQLLRSDVRDFCDRSRFDHYIPLAQQHGEFELLFTATDAGAVLHAEWPGPAPIPIGTVTDDQGVRFTSPSVRSIDGAALRNAMWSAHTPVAVLEALLALLADARP
jgi:thiamine-monophosphate kinase